MSMTASALPAPASVTLTPELIGWLKELEDNRAAHLAYLSARRVVASLIRFESERLSSSDATKAAEKLREMVGEMGEAEIQSLIEDGKNLKVGS